MLAGNTVLSGDIVAEVANTSCKSELFVIVWRERYRFLALAVVECDIGQIGNIALLGHHKSHLYVFTSELLVTKHKGIFVECLSDDGCSVE